MNVTAETIAQHMAWQLSNSNSEIDVDGKVVDVAFNAWHAGSTVTLLVDTWDSVAREQESHVFTLTVAREVTS